MAADRLSLHSNGKLYDMFSPQNLISCNKDHIQKGCNGGHLDRAWWFLRKVGLVCSLVCQSFEVDVLFSSCFKFKEKKEILIVMMNYFYISPEVEHRIPIVQLTL